MSGLEIHRGDAPLIVAFPHTGTDIPPDIEARLIDPWRARKDCDWWIDQLYAFVRDMGATTVRTTMSRTVIDVNRDPSGASLYPGQATTELCTTTTFDGEPLYRHGWAPDETEISHRRTVWFDPYHAALEAEIARLKAVHDTVVLYDAHSIRSNVPRLFDGELPQFNIGTNNDTTCDPALSEAVKSVCEQSSFSHVLNGRFKGGWTTRHYGQPLIGVHAIQMELACRGYMDESSTVDFDNWPTPFDADRARAVQTQLSHIIAAVLVFAARN
ncbi:N-formylglutamate deformylase [Asticcacaulis sp. SL142]|uniref:N-formylglutamate deformylase n=1 Tax=Asticcacaulis sp. SL142 TaxID=2995155 RepID=UPI00226D3B0F|nr:N-formylglutamate deformylase [Asticcacaulis sp. SL142]WAC48411.1 N-formylglutamate deformylase [Asticcacaulis sp. SL142]